ncbi:hypothetical protein, partial [Cellulosimicrobium sp. CpK407]|uniref:hypothetical protein n=1 Tax=Cellulosimicrobium sp. CpK407 TaxID=3229847 RepID=UPI003F364704
MTARLLALAGLVGAIVANVAPPDGTRDAEIWGELGGSKAIVHGTAAPNGGAEYVPAAADGGPASEAYRRGPAYRCYDGDHATTLPGLVPVCPDGQNAAVFDPGCTPDEVALEPLFRQTWTNTPDGTRTAVSAWELVADASCLGAVDLAGEAEAAFRTLTIAPSPIVVQP